ncbi:MAG: type VI secretion system tube protein Hcp, partial [Azoarcus sp.]|nr:type VI secretion system tube protein Hcp [Azoarcus sp.]
MAFDAFLKIDGIPGESLDDKHQDWIEILSYHHGLIQPASATASSAGGASAERVTFGPFSITKQVDKATPKLFEAGCTGKHIKEITLEVCRSGSDKQKYLEIKMEQVLISAYNHEGGGDFPVESISFTPGRFKIVYSQQKRDSGALGGQVAAGW